MANISSVPMSLKTFFGSLCFQIIISLIKAAPVYYAFHKTFYNFINTQLETFLKGEVLFILVFYFIGSVVLSILFYKYDFAIIRMFASEMSGAFTSYLQVIIGMLLYFLFTTFQDPTFYVDVRIAFKLFVFLDFILMIYMLLFSSVLVRNKIILNPITEEQVATIKSIPSVVMKLLKKIITKN
jgi:hypothetical protein